MMSCFNPANELIIALSQRMRIQNEERYNNVNTHPVLNY